MRCYLCGSENIIKTGTKKGKYELLFCKKCSLGFINPLPNKKELYSYYNSYLREKGYKYLNDNLREYKIKHLWNERFNLISQYTKNIEDLLFLEVGPGTGEWLELIQHRGVANSFGIEISSEEYEILFDKYGDKIINTSLVNYRSDKTFDIICLWDVLEHFQELNKNILKLSRILRKNGLLCFSVPNINSLSWLIKKEKWKYFSPPEHIFYFNKKSIEHLSKKFGFDLVYYKTNTQLQAYLYNNDCDTKIKDINIGLYALKNKIEKIITPLNFGKGEIITFILRKI